ncbi:Glucan endo-1,3-beta-glucosidase 3 [Linum perenne]
MPSPPQVVALLKAQNIRHVRLYDADRDMLTALGNSGIHVTISVPNDQILGIGQSIATAANWVARNVISHVPGTNITAIAVGSEVLTTLPNAAPVLVSALKFIHSALVAAKLDSQIKVSTPHSSSIILDYKEAVDSNTLLHYTNVFDALVDAAYSAMSGLNFTNVPVVVTETGWPSKGDSSEQEATAENANTYNSNLIKHVLNNTGTPKHPGIAVSTYIYELYNEDLSTRTVSEKNWGLFDANGIPVYILHLTGSGTVLANDSTNQTFCVAKERADRKQLQAALDWACGPGRVDCSPMLKGEPCYQPDNVIAHATFAFNAYYQRMAKSPGSCDFKGVAAITTTDPSKQLFLLMLLHVRLHVNPYYLVIVMFFFPPT